MSSSSDILDYLSTLMTAANRLQGKGSGGGLEGVGRETTTRAFFKPDLLQSSNFLNKGKETFMLPETNQELQTKEKDSWLTAEDIINAAEHPDSVGANSPIILIPFEDKQPSGEFSWNELPAAPFTILDMDTSTSTAGDQEESNPKVGYSSDRFPMSV